MFSCYSSSSRSHADRVPAEGVLNSWRHEESVVEQCTAASRTARGAARSPARGDPYLSTPVTVCESERPLFQLATPGACQSRDTAPPFSGQLVPRRLLRSTGGGTAGNLVVLQSTPPQVTTARVPPRPSVRPLLAPPIARWARRRAPAVTLQRAAARRDPGRLAPLPAVSQARPRHRELLRSAGIWRACVWALFFIFILKK